MSIFGVDSDEAWDYIERLMPNLVMAGSSSATFNSIVQGEYVVGLTYENGAAIPLSNGADNIRLVYPTEGVSAAASGVAVIKNCPHPAAAKAFVDTLMTAEAQTIASEVDTGTRFTNKNMTLSDACVLPSSDSILGGSSCGRALRAERDHSGTLELSLGQSQQLRPRLHEKAGPDFWRL